MVAGTTAFALGLIAFAHTPAARPLLAAIGRLPGGHAGCPLGYDRPATGAQRERIRRNLSANLRGARPAARRPALVFDLDLTREADVVAFMKGRGIACHPGSGMADLVCDGVPGRVLGSREVAGVDRNLWFTFGDGHRLVSLVAVSKTSAPGPISDGYQAATREIAERVGQPSTVSGDADSSFLSGGALRQASAEFRFSNYYASARATNLGNGFLLTEEYRALVD